MSEQILLNPAQKQALKSINKSKENKALIVLPSGVGKTILSAVLTKNVKGRVLFLVHRNEILDQAVKEYVKVNPEIANQIGILSQTRKHFNKKYTFSMIQTLSRKKTLQKFNPKDFEIIILDEYHHSASPTYKRVIDYFKPKKFYGLTATPHRLDGKDIMKDVNNNVAFKMELNEAIDQELVCPFIYYGMWDNIDYSDIKYDHKRYTERDLDKKLLVSKRDEAIVREFKKKLSGRKSIGFCCSVNHVERCVRVFNKAGIRSIGITHKQPSIARKKIMEDFKIGKYQIIFTRDIFNEGVDFPQVEGLLFLRPTFSKTIFLQQLGRGLRKNKGKKNVKILDFIGNYVNAYQIQEWLGEITSSNRKVEGKEVYAFNPKNKVYFDSKVLDIFETQKKTVITKKDLIDDYFRVKKELERQPLRDEMIKLSHHPFYWYDKLFGRWGKFKESIGEKEKHDEEELIQRYNSLKEKLKRVPSVKEFRNFYKFKYALSKSYGSHSYYDFLRRRGDLIRYKRELVQSKPKYYGNILKAIEQERGESGRYTKI